MSWAMQRRLLILTTVGVVVVLIVGTALFFALHKPATCTDGKQNQDEQGIDCGGICTSVCRLSVIEPTVSFTRALPQGQGRVDVISYINNPNVTAAGTGVQYTLELYDKTQALIIKREGTVDLAPGIETPVFIPRLDIGTAQIDRAFLSLATASSSWFRSDMPPHTVRVSNPRVTGTEGEPRVEAMVENPYNVPLRNTILIATLFNAEGNAIAASQTLIPELNAYSSTKSIFTWNTPFSDTVSRIEVRPRLIIVAP